ncbi:MAG: PqqD family peptide modification chaperone [Gemmatimonadota bacterium]|nr:PqqD family peptide modification chaperone [Gemmatimonadota bacterium]
MSEITLDSVVVAGPDQVSTGVEEDAVLLSLRDSTYYGLNPVGARIWSLLSEPVLVSQIVETLLSEYEVARDECEADVLDVLGELFERGLVKQGPA